MRRFSSFVIYMTNTDDKFYTTLCHSRMLTVTDLNLQPLQHRDEGIETIIKRSLATLLGDRGKI